MNWIYVLIIAGLALSTKVTGNQESLDRFSWLIGSWHIPGDGPAYYEYWERENDSLFTGEGMVLDGPDTVFYESIELKLSGTDIYYIVSSREQYGENTVSFRLAEHADNTFIFENPQHDYPQRIVYRHPCNDSLSAYIEGTVNGKLKRSDFPMIRMK